jgi:predicted homoserine dehydrogenase-like protein
MTKNKIKNETYTIEAYMRQTNKEAEWRDLNIKLKNSMGDGTFIDDNEVMLILTALAHARGIEHAFKRMFLDLCTEKQEAIDALHKNGEQKEKV